MCQIYTEHHVWEESKSSYDVIRAGFPEVPPCGAAEPSAERGDGSGGGPASVHQRVAGGSALPYRAGEEDPRSRRRPVRYKYMHPIMIKRSVPDRRVFIRDEENSLTSLCPCLSRVSVRAVDLASQRQDRNLFHKHKHSMSFYDSSLEGVRCPAEPQANNEGAGRGRRVHPGR